MSTVTLEEAQAHLSELIERLDPGEEILITDQAQPWPKLRRLSGARGPARRVATGKTSSRWLPTSTPHWTTSRSTFRPLAHHRPRWP